MGYTPIYSYNTQVKIAGQDIILKRYKKNQLRGYSAIQGGKKSALIIPWGNMTEEQRECNTMMQAYAALNKNSAGRVKSDEEKRIRFEKSVFRARENIFDLIASNVGKWTSFQEQLRPYFRANRVTAKFVTLTFNRRMQDIEDCNNEFMLFIKRLNYLFCGKNAAYLKYIAIPELQERGTWHYHVLFFNLPLIAVNISKAFEMCEKGMIRWGCWENLTDIWGNGFVGINVIKDNDRAAAYVTKYLTKGIDVEGGKVKYNTEGDNDGLKRLSDYGLYKRLGLENMKRYQGSKGLHKAVKVHVMQSKENIEQLIEQLKQKKALVKLNKEGQKVKRFEYSNEYRGDIFVCNFRLKIDELKEFKKVIFDMCNAGKVKKTIKIPDRPKFYPCVITKEILSVLSAWDMVI